MDKQEYIQDSIDKLFTTWMRRAAGFGALIFMLLAFLDFVVFREHFAIFLVYRVAISSFLLLIAVLAGKTVNRTALRSFGLAAIAASAVTIEAMILHTGGHHSSYATGMILLAVIALTFVPADFPFHATTAAVIYGIYLLPIIMAGRMDDTLTFFTTNFFMCSIILTVVVFRYLSMQSIRKQLGTEYELIASNRRVRESENYFRSIAEVSEILIYRLSARGEVSYVSPAIAEQFGYETKDAVGRHFLDFVMPVSHAAANAVFHVLFSGQSVRDTDLQLRRADGSSFDATINMTPVFHNGEMIEAQGIVINITKRKRAEEEVRRLAVEQKIILDNIASGVFFLKSRTVIWTNMKAATMFDYSLEEIFGKDVSLFYPDRESFEELGIEAYPLLPQGKTYSVERQMKKKGGEIIWCSLIGQAVNALDLEQGSIWLLDDITERKLLGEELKKYQTQLEEMVATRTVELEKTIAQLEAEAIERKRAEEALKESEERFKKLLDNAPIAISIINMDGTVEYVNQKHPEIMGYDLQDIPTLECWWSQAYPEQTDRTRIKETWYKLTQRVFQGEKIAAVNRRVVCKDGTIKELELSFSAAASKIIVAFGDITERKRAEEKLRESENRFRTLFEKANEGIMLFSIKTEIIAVNESYARMHGYSVEEMLDISLWDLNVTLDPQTHAARLNRVIAEGSIVFEVEHRHKAGHTFPLEVSVTVIELNNEKFFLCFHHDISERKKAEKELREKEAKMRAMLESFDGLIYICSPDYRVEFMNENLVRRTGRNAVGEPCYAVLNDRNSICPWCVNERVSKGEIIRYEIQSPKDGLWYHVVNTPIRHDGGSVSKLAMFLDVTERKKAEIALMKSEERYRRLVASVTDYIYTVTVEDGKPVVTEHGEGCFAVTGYSPNQYEADTDLWYRMICDADRDAVIEQSRMIIAGEKTEPLEHRIVHRDGSIRWVRNVMVPLFDKHWQLVSFDGLISDITEKKMLEEKLEKARMLEEENLKFFSRRLIEVQEEERRAIARELHDEIGQSLTGMKLSVEIIADSLPSEHADNIRSIEVSLGELLSLVRNISLDLRPAMLDEFGLVNTLIWYFERYTSRTGISVDFIRTGADRRFDRQKEIALYRITQEAMTNVARYAEVMCVLVEFIIGQDRVTVRIKDEGRGFDIENTTNSGSGLSIMRERAIILRGTFSLSSAPGKGTEITVEIPLQDKRNAQKGIL
ncbi:MAG: PAS domain S-box protein [Thermodesulfovibrionales bacterium]